MSRPPSPRQQADAIRRAGRRACHAGLPETVNPYNQFLAAMAWALWRQGWQFGAEERVDAAMEVIELCDDCAAAVESGDDPPARPGLLGNIKARWPAHDLLLRDDENADVDDRPDDADDGIDLPRLWRPTARATLARARRPPRFDAKSARATVSIPRAGGDRQHPVDAARAQAGRHHDSGFSAAGIRIALRRELVGSRDRGPKPGSADPVEWPPGTGRSSLALQIATIAAGRTGQVVWFAQDRNDRQVTTHLLTQAGLPMKPAVPRRSPMTQTVVNRLAALMLRIDDQPELSVRVVRERCTELVAGGGLALVVIDYVQLIKLNRRGSSFEAALQLAKQDLRAMSRALNVPVLIIGSQPRQRPAETQSPPGPDLQRLDPHAVCDRVLVLQRAGEVGQLLIVRPAETAIPMRFDPVGLRFGPAAGLAS